MPLCKYGCGEEITWIDGKPFSLQSHFKVCRPAGKKKPKPDRELIVALTAPFGPERANELVDKYPGKTAEEIVTLELKQ